MAFLTDTLTGRNDLGHTFAAWVETTKERLAKRKMRLETLRELKSLSDKELADIGVSRAEIPGVAYRVAYGEDK